MIHIRTTRLIYRTLLAAFVLFALSACRDKTGGTGPDDPGIPGEWSLVLHAPLKMHTQGNDTIPVRVYTPEGTLASGINVYSDASSDTNVVSYITVTRTDTATRWWGSDPAIIYWGVGDSTGHDTVRSWAIQPGTLDTLAQTIAVFEVIG